MPKTHGNGSGMMRKRADNTWEYRCSYGTDLSGKLITKSFYGKTQAICRAKKEEYDKKCVPLTKVQTVNQWALKWLDIYKKDKCGINTYNQYVSIVNKYIISKIGTMKLDKVKPAHIMELMNECRGLSQSLVAKIRMVLYSIFDTAVDNDFCSKNPVKNIRVDGVKAIEKEIFTEDELQIIFSHCKKERSNISDALFALLYTGFRREELLGLMWEDIDFANNTITTCRTVIVQEGKKTLKNSMKNIYSNRTIPLFQPLKEILQDKERRSSFVFPTVSGEYYSPHRFNEAFRRLLERINRQTNESTNIKILTPHNCRHTFASRLLEKGVDIKIIQLVLGHADIAMTGNIYTHANINTIKSAVITVEL